MKLGSLPGLKMVPLKAAAGFLLTVGATFGITVLVFQQGHLAALVGLDTPGPLVSFLPIPVGSFLMSFRFLQVAWSFWRTGELPHHDESQVAGMEEAASLIPPTSARPLATAS